MAHKAEKEYITPQLLHQLLQEFAKAYNRENREIINIFIVGGSALQIKYGSELREVTFDGDAYWIPKTNLDISRYIKIVSEKFNIPDDWLNEDFRYTKSFSRHIVNDAILVHVYGSVNVYVVSDLTQLCMKMTSSRSKDLLDAIELADKLTLRGCSMNDIKNRSMELYNGSVGFNSLALASVEKVINKKISANSLKSFKNKIKKQIKADEVRKQKYKNKKLSNKIKV